MTEPLDEAPRPAPGLVQVLLLLAVFLLLFGVEVFEGVANLLGLPPYYLALGIQELIPWPVLIAGIVLPVVLYVLAIVVGRGRALFARAVILVIALAVANALAAGLVALADHLTLAGL